MNYFKLLLIACLVLLPMQSLAADDDYGYPIPGSYEATILGTPAKLMPEFPKKIRTRQLVLDVIPNRQKPPVFFYDEGLRCTFAYQEQKAPLIFLIAGAGSSDYHSDGRDESDRSGGERGSDHDRIAPVLSVAGTDSDR